MNSKKNRILTAFTFLFGLLAPISARSFILSNNSGYEIKYNLGNDAEYLNQYSVIGGIPLPHKGSIKLDDNQQIALVRSGFGSNCVSRWTDAPHLEALATRTLSSSQLSSYRNALSQGQLPIITIKADYTGRNFEIGHTN